MRLDESELRHMRPHQKRTPGQIYSIYRESKRLHGKEYANLERGLYCSGAIYLGCVENFGEQLNIWRAYVRIFDESCNPDSVKHFASALINHVHQLKVNFAFYRLSADSDVIYTQFTVEKYRIFHKLMNS